MKKYLYKRNGLVLSAAFIVISLIVGGWGFVSNDPLPYKNAKLPVDARVKDLLSRMTLEEKVAQTHCIWQQKSLILDDKGNFSPDKAKDILKYGIGQIARPSE